MCLKSNNIYIIILNSIADVLYNYYNGEIAVESNYVKQGFKEPCFFIELIDTLKNRRLENKQIRTYQIDIQYINGNLGRDDLNSIGDDLFEILEAIPLRSSTKNYIRAYKYDRKIVGDILHFIVTYHVYLQKELDEQLKMETLGNKVSEVKNEESLF